MQTLRLRARQFELAQREVGKAQASLLQPLDQLDLFGVLESRLPGQLGSRVGNDAHMPRNVVVRRLPAASSMRQSVVHTSES